MRWKALAPRGGRGWGGGRRPPSEGDGDAPGSAIAALSVQALTAPAPPSDSDHVDVVRCPACHAGMRPGSPWCSLCYADLRPKAPTPVEVPRPRTKAPALIPASAGLSDATISPTESDPAAAGGWPCGTCRTTVAIDLSSCPSCGGAFSS